LRLAGGRPLELLKSSKERYFMKFKFGTTAMFLVAAVMVVVLAAPMATPVAAQRQAARPQVDRPDGFVWEVIRKNCTACHGIDDYAFFALDRAGWQNLIESKHKTGVSLTDKDRDALMEWLVGDGLVMYDGQVFHLTDDGIAFAATLLM